jgi:DNA primase
MSAIDEVKQRIDIVEIIGQYVTLTKSGRNFRALCPFHNEKTPSFFVFPDRQSWHCFGACNTGGDTFAFLMKKENMDFPEALRRLADKVGVTLPSSREVDTKKEARERFYQVNDIASQYYHSLLTTSASGERARAYLKSRGLTGASIDEFRLGYAMESWDALKTQLKDRGLNESELVEAGLLSSGDSGRTYDRWRNRLMFPIMDERGHVTGFGARVLDPAAEGPKYINTPQTPVFDKSSTLYGLHLATPGIRQQNAAVIVEGYMDVIVAHQYGFTNVVASMGTSITEKQVNILKKMSHNVVMALDSDSAGSEAMQRCVDHENTLEAEIKVVILPEGKDPDDVIKADADIWRKLLVDARPVIDYIFDMAVAGLDLTRVSDRTKVRDRLYPVVDNVKDVVRRAYYLQKLAGLIGVTDTSLEASMKRKMEVRGKSVHVTDPGTPGPGQDLLFRSKIEEYCLILLIQRPELREAGKTLPQEYFENSEDREIYQAWYENEDPSPEVLKQKVDISIREHLQQLIDKDIPVSRIEEKYHDCVLRMREKYLRNLERKREAFLTLETDFADELVRSKEVSAELKQVFGLKARREQGLRS